MTNLSTSSLPPGFRFHPTDEELILHYLQNRASASPCPVSIIAEVDIYKFDPWELPAKAAFGEGEWYFFSPRDRKYPNGMRPNRAAGCGYWKATGTDKPIHTGTGTGKESTIGVKKALVFYKGKPPKGQKTNWIMHEYRLAEVGNTNAYKPLKLRDHSMRLDDWVLCRIYKKSNVNLRDQEQEDVLPTLHVVADEEEPVMNLHKSFSISEFLDVDYAQPEFPGFDYTSFVANQGQSTTTTIQSRVDSPTKRQRTADGSCFGPGFANQFDSTYGQCSLFNQQMLLNSYLGLHGAQI